MYQLSIQQEFVAQHYLTVPDCGPENVLHSHIYALELLLEGKKLNQHGYLVDIDEVKTSMNEIIARYKDNTLNDDPAFAGLNPSIEHFSRIIVEYLKESIHFTHVVKITARMWEDRHCWASYSAEV